MGLGSNLHLKTMSMRLLILGEFRISNVILLLSLYGITILSIPLVLSSFVETSSDFLGFTQYRGVVALVSSVSSEVITSYDFVEVALFAGFVVASILSGISIARKSRRIEFIMTQLGESKPNVRKDSVFLLGIISIVCVGMAFSLSIVAVSVFLYLVSIVLHIPYVLPTINTTFGLYFAAVFAVCFASLVFGWSRKTGGN